MRGRLTLGLLVAAGILAADRLSKWWVLDGLFGLSDPITPASRADPVQVTGFFNFALVWNNGVSFGFLSSDTPLARWGLVALALAIVGWLTHWLSRSTRLWQGIAIGLVIGGAIGNVADRLRFGAVADFLHFYAMGYSFWVFNVADGAITVGVVLLLIDGLLADRKAAAAARHGGTS